MRDSLNNQTVLVTGASGFIGEHIAKKLVAQHARVLALGWQHPVQIPDSVSISADLSDPRAVHALVHRFQPTTVFHCAAVTNAAYCQQNPRQARRAIVDATRHLTQALSVLSATPIIVALSTDLVFDGEQPPYDESSIPQPLSVYGQLKWEAEAPVLDFPTGTVIRASLVYGPATTHKTSFIGWIIDSLRQGKPLQLFEDEIRTPIFIDDLCRAMICLATDRQTGLWHAGGPQSLDRACMGRMICQALGFDEQLIQPITLSQSTYPAPRPRNVALDSTKLWTYLRSTPRSFQDGLKACLEYPA